MVATVMEEEEEVTVTVDTVMEDTAMVVEVVMEEEEVVMTVIVRKVEEVMIVKKIEEDMNVMKVENQELKKEDTVDLHQDLLLEEIDQDPQNVIRLLMSKFFLSFSFYYILYFYLNFFFFSKITFIVIGMRSIDVSINQALI